jgi:hypothetical protein
VTATASWDLGTGWGLDLECDDCGYVISRIDAGLGDWRTLWATAQRLGWDGAAQTDGPHSCSDCLTVGTAAVLDAVGPLPTVPVPAMRPAA